MIGRGAGSGEPPAVDALAGVARDASTLADIVTAFEEAGYRGQLSVRPGGALECLTCHHVLPAATFGRPRLRRLEGASDPDDELAVLALVCPNCATRGTVVVNGRLVENQHVAAARRLLALSDMIAKLEAGQ